jgi:hypothetical protein
MVSGFGLGFFCHLGLQNEDNEIVNRKPGAIGSLNQHFHTRVFVRVALQSRPTFAQHKTDESTMISQFACLFIGRAIKRQVRVWRPVHTKIGCFLSKLPQDASCIAASFGCCFARQLSPASNGTPRNGKPLFISKEQIEIKNRNGKQETVHAVKNAAVSGYYMRAVLDCSGSFQHRFRKVSKLAGYADKH